MRYFRNNRERQDDLFQRLMRQHKRQRRRKAIHDFLSSPKWYGIGPIISFATLIVTIFLAVYIFNLGREQQIAHMSGKTDMRILKEDYNSILIQSVLFVRNDGPATGQAVLVTVTSDRGPLECSNRNISGYLSPSKVTTNLLKCEYFFDYFYPHSYTEIVVTELIRFAEGASAEDLTNIESTGIGFTISGANVPTQPNTIMDKFMDEMEKRLK